MDRKEKTIKDLEKEIDSLLQQNNSNESDFIIEFAKLTIKNNNKQKIQTIKVHKEFIQNMYSALQLVLDKERYEVAAKIKKLIDEHTKNVFYILDSDQTCINIVEEFHKEIKNSICY